MVSRHPPRPTSIHAGQRVQVPWGRDDVSGTVVEVYGSGRLARALVAVRSGQGSGDDATFSVPLSSVKVRK